MVLVGVDLKAALKHAMDTSSLPEELDLPHLISTAIEGLGHNITKLQVELVALKQRLEMMEGCDYTVPTTTTSEPN